MRSGPRPNVSSGPRWPRAWATDATARPCAPAGTRLLLASAHDDLGARYGALPTLDRKRLAGLLRLRERWRATGPWPPLHAALAHGAPRMASASLTRERSAVAGGAISPARARILAANVVLPFAVACAHLNADLSGEARAIEVYTALAAPPSTLTRLLARQFGLTRLPTGAAAHMGSTHLERPLPPEALRHLPLRLSMILAFVAPPRPAGRGGRG